MMMRQRRGMSVLLVLSVIAMTFVMGLAMLSSATLQAQTGRSAGVALQASALAASGVDLAGYYLMYPWRAPSLATGPSGSYWPGGTNISLGSGAAGMVNLTVVPAGGNDYVVTSVAKATSGSRSITRTVTARLRVTRGAHSEYAVTFNGSPSVTLQKATVTGDVQAVANIVNNVAVTGKVIAGGTISGTGSATAGNKASQAVAASPMAPSAANVLDLGTSYAYGINQYAPKTLSGSIGAGTWGPTSDNPGAVFVATSGLNITGTAIINGTLIVKGGPLTISGTGITITPRPGYPAVVVTNDITTGGIGAKTMTANGLVYTSGTIRSVLLSSGTLTINGALSFGGSSAIDASFSGTVKIVNKPDNIADVGIDKTALPPGVMVLSWKE
jgi:hypothetical protein